MYTNAPAIQAGFWIGGYRASGTTASITDSTRDYAAGMIQLNTTTGQYTALDGPYEAVEEGSLSYVPVGDKGILVYIGGDVPSIKDGINATMSAVRVDDPCMKIRILIKVSELMEPCPSVRHCWGEMV